MSEMTDLVDGEWRALNYTHIAVAAKKTDPYWRTNLRYAQKLIEKGLLEETETRFQPTSAGRKLLGLIDIPPHEQSE